MCIVRRWVPWLLGLCCGACQLVDGTSNNSPVLDARVAPDLGPAIDVAPLGDRGIPQDLEPTVDAPADGTIEMDATPLPDIITDLPPEPTRARLCPPGSAPCSCPKGQWCWNHPRPQGNVLRDVWISPTNVRYAVGAAGTIIRYDGTTWNLLPSGGGALIDAIDGIDESHMIIGGRGDILRLRHPTLPGPWTITPVTDRVTDVLMTDVDSAFATTDNGKILQITINSGVVAVTEVFRDPMGRRLNTLGLVGNEIWVAGNNTLMLLNELSAGDPRLWHTVNPPAGTPAELDIRGVWGSADDVAYFAGNGVSGTNRGMILIAKPTTASGDGGPQDSGSLADGTSGGLFDSGTPPIDPSRSWTSIPTTPGLNTIVSQQTSKGKRVFAAGANNALYEVFDDSRLEAVSTGTATPSATFRRFGVSKNILALVGDRGVWIEQPMPNGSFLPISQHLTEDWIWSVSGSADTVVASSIGRVFTKRNATQSWTEIPTTNGNNRQLYGIHAFSSRSAIVVDSSCQHAVFDPQAASAITFSAIPDCAPSGQGSRLYALTGNTTEAYTTGTPSRIKRYDLGTNNWTTVLQEPGLADNYMVVAIDRSGQLLLAGRQNATNGRSRPKIFRQLADTSWAQQSHPREFSGTGFGWATISTLWQPSTSRTVYGFGYQQLADPGLSASAPIGQFNGPLTVSLNSTNVATWDFHVSQTPTPQFTGISKVIEAQDQTVYLLSNDRVLSYTPASATAPPIDMSLLQRDLDNVTPILRDAWIDGNERLWVVGHDGAILHKQR